MQHLKRIITSLIGAPLLLLFIYKASYLMFSVFVFIISIIALYEYFKVTLNKEHTTRKSPVVLIAFITLIIINYGAYVTSFDYIVFALVFNFICVSALSLPEFKDNSKMYRTVSIQIQSSIYIPLFLSFLIFIRNSHIVPNDNYGVLMIILLCFLVGMGDTGAYYIGRNFGKRKIIPWVSPNKTLEGYLGGLIISISTGCVYKYYLLKDLEWIPSIIFFASVAIAAPLGDLFESTLKRAGDIKDSGTILPGHGGMLDRIDALLFAIPVTYFFMKYIFKL
ncbi:MAG: phosphatidate cytidylyltransferase [Desulfobacterales bacterium]|nr:phosphatidate cytidylyltransferase [Desulfobacterales bacterium]